MLPGALQLSPLPDFPAVVAGDVLADLVITATRRSGHQLQDGAVLVIAQKVVSKAEGRLVHLQDVIVTAEARTLAKATQKDPRLVTLILQESRAVIRTRPGLIISEHRTGHILANAGIDSSNVGAEGQSESVLLWPEDPDASARTLSLQLSAALNRRVPVLINDSLGRPWRMGTVGFAIGTFGFEPVWDQIGEKDLDGRIMRVTAPAIADALAAAASLVQGETNQGRPAVWVEGCDLRHDDQVNTSVLLRPAEQDLFR
ncbi:coenzyme F420-0:L-glutamate ligase [Luminiphilus sp.]|nr:coenzyme F420-0:L-glutamate ligase [Luminiphilus sp.]MDB2643992.1 coenzyme F420-0:L-glutamate ligase [Luminiphilus sp.]MDB4048658.1 coenzyme F420-0:L-glutamate ligase [Luminiphilus sp.]MDC1117109.1 coenzyme F420-0:L-glutamate ligase [Luminiphilus sp.]